MIWEDQVNVVNVVVTDSTQEMVVTSVINQVIGVVVKLNTIVKICKYRRFHEGHHLIPMVAMRCMAHPGMMLIISLGNVFVFSMINNRKVIYPFFLHSNFQASC